MMYFVEEGESHDEINPQISDTTCGQVCIAMIAGKEIQEVIRDMKTSGSTSIGQLIEILDQYQIQHAEKKTKGSQRRIRNQIRCQFLPFIWMLVILIGSYIMNISIMTPNLA